MNLKEREEGRRRTEHNGIHTVQRWEERQCCQDQPALSNLFDVCVGISVLNETFEVFMDAGSEKG